MQIKVKSSPYILVVRKVVVSLKCQKEINQLKIKDMKVQAYLKNHSKNEFYIKPLKKGYYAVMDGYDKSMASLEISEEAAINKMNELNQLRNGRIKKKKKEN